MTLQQILVVSFYFCNFDVHIFDRIDISPDDPRVVLTHNECMALLEQERSATNKAYSMAIQDQEAAKSGKISRFLIAVEY